MPEATPANPLPPFPPCDGPVRLAVLVSGGGTTLDNLARRIADETLSAEIKIVIVSRPDVGAIQIAKQHGLPCETLTRKSFPDVVRYSAEVFSVIEKHEVQLVCLAGFLSLLHIPDDFAGRVLNIHPALLPKFGGQGMYGRRVHEAVLAAGEKTSGCTVHFADNTYDTGPILHQRTCPVEKNDTPETLAARVFAQECEAFPQAISALAQGRVRRQDGQASIAPDEKIITQHEKTKS